MREYLHVRAYVNYYTPFIYSQYHYHRPPPPSFSQFDHPAFKRPKRAPALAEFPDVELAAASALVAEEASHLRLDLALASTDDAPDSIDSVWGSVYASHVYLRRTREYVPKASAPPAEVCAALREEHASLSALADRDGKRVSKLHARLGVLTKGYEARAAALNSNIAAAADEGLNSAIELSAFTRLAHDEASALTSRIARAHADWARETERERALQERYAKLVRELDDLRRLLAPVL